MVGETANWIQLLVQEGTSAGRMKQQCWGDAQRSPKLPGNLPPQPLPPKPTGRGISLLPPPALEALVPPIDKALQGPSSSHKIVYNTRGGLQ